MTVVVTAVFHPTPGRFADLVEALQESILAVHEEQGCLLYSIHDADDGTITMIEKWTSTADLDAHTAGAAVAALNGRVKPLIAEPTTVTRMMPIAAGTGTQGLL
jgi:quinol monooxygenase YgiN